MSSEFSYKILIISKSEEIFSKCEGISKDNAIECIKTTSMMEGLESLMDSNVDSIVIDLEIGEDETIKFLEHISNDYENKLTPIIIISNTQDGNEISRKISEFNVISVMSNSGWNFQAIKLLNFLRIQKLKLHSMQNNLLKSEDRGTIDELTGAYNRYGYENIFHILASRFKAYDEPFCAIMLDIDHFKSVNDTYGHDIGDEVLEEFSKIIMSSIRVEDSLIRLGGEEFLIFMSNVNIHVAIKNAEKIRTKIKDALHSSKNLKITASFGVVSYKLGEDKDSIVKKSDELLYIAKHSGRDIVISEISKID